MPELAKRRPDAGAVVTALGRAATDTQGQIDNEQRKMRGGSGNAPQRRLAEFTRWFRDYRCAQLLVVIASCSAARRGTAS